MCNYVPCLFCAFLLFTHSAILAVFLSFFFPATAFSFPFKFQLRNEETGPFLAQAPFSLPVLAAGFHPENILYANRKSWIWSVSSLLKSLYFIVLYALIYSLELFVRSKFLLNGECLGERRSKTSKLRN